MPDGVESDKSLAWLEENYGSIENFGRIECPSCHSRALTVLDISCPNCGLIIAKNRMPIDKDGIARLAGGITANEAMKSAEKWWNGVGRKYYQAMRARYGDTLATVPELRRNPLLNGRPFIELDRRQKFAVVKEWHMQWYQLNHADPSPPDVAAIII